MQVAMTSLGLLLAAVAGCSEPPTASPSGPTVEDRPAAWPKDWSKHLGQTVTLEGRAADAKLGALLEGDGRDIWIDGLDHWPEELYTGDGKGKRLRVAAR
jgi:hypothetical protein